MLDLKRIKEEKEKITELLARKGFKADFDTILALDEKRREAIAEAESYKAERNKVSAEIPALKKAGKPVDFDELRAEHEAAGVLLESLSALTNQYTAPADGCATYVYVFKTMKALEEGLHEHIFLENSVLFEMP